MPASNKRLLCQGKELKVKNADSDKTEYKFRLCKGCISVMAHPEIVRMFEVRFVQTKYNSAPTVYTFLADSLKSRDVIVLTLKAVSNQADP